MADEVALGFLGDIEEPFWMFIRSTDLHSGNDNKFNRAFQKFLVEGRSQPAGYYGGRLKDLKLVAGKPLIQWSEE